ncbi:hypothetical protein BH11MYX4_BH11MYX4_05410 [soil metagenome]
MGDPQTTFANVLGILGSHDLLGDDGYLRDDVGLVSIGDHFDFASHEAVAGVRGAWEHGQLAALDLRPLHFAGEAGHEGGGLLYHRPSNRGDDTGSDKPVARRRFHPRELPRGLVQICGHTGHKKCRKELAEWHAPAPAPRTHGGLRTLAVGESGIVYSESIEPARDGDATYYFIDIEMNAPEVRDYPLFELESVR